MPAIEVRELSKTYRVYRKREGLLASMAGLFRREYNAVAAVDRVSFEVETGEIVAFLGPNGARQNDHAQAALRADLPQRRRSPRARVTFPGSGTTPSAAGSRW